MTSLETPIESVRRQIQETKKNIDQIKPQIGIEEELKKIFETKKHQQSINAFEKYLKKHYPNNQDMLRMYGIFF